MATVVSGFPEERATDRAFFVAFVAHCWTGVLFGFFPASGARMMGKADYVAPLILHIHAASFVGWLALLTTQMLLIRKGRCDLHMKLGLVAVLLIPVMAYSGLAAEHYSQRFYIQRDDDGLDFFILPLFYSFAFPAFAVTAILFARRDSAAHKRLILMATTIIVGAAYARWWDGPLERLFGDAYWGTIFNSFTGTNLIHRVYMIGVPLILAGQLLCSWIYHADWWPPLSRELIELRLPLST